MDHFDFEIYKGLSAERRRRVVWDKLIWAAILIGFIALLAIFGGVSATDPPGPVPYVD